MLRIMLVDDEENILKALKRVLRSERWQVETHSVVPDALRALETGDYALIISDFRMPNIDGVEFLEYCQARQPNAIRMVLSAQCDRDSVVDAINRAGIYRFIDKPWDDNELRITVERALEHFQLLRENQRLLDEVKTQRQKLTRLEQTHPELFHVERDDTGAIILDTDEK